MVKSLAEHCEGWSARRWERQQLRVVRTALWFLPGKPRRRSYIIDVISISISEREVMLEEEYYFASRVESYTCLVLVDLETPVIALDFVTLHLRRALQTGRLSAPVSSFDRPR